MDLNKPERINEAAQELLQKRFDKVEPKFVKSVVDWITKFKTTNGSIIRTKANTDRISGFSTAVNRFLLNAGYNAMFDGFLENFDILSETAIQIHDELNGIQLTKSFINPFKTWAVNNVISDMTGQGLNTNLINPLRNELFIAVNQGSTLTDVIKSISGQLTTTIARQGILKRIALQASRDALGQYDGIVNEAVRKSYNLDALLYVGSLVKDSREQCQRWVDYDKYGKVGMLLFADLEEEISWAEDNGTGMIPNTTPENFCQNRGGFNCRHNCYPIRRPKDKTTPEDPTKEFVEAKTIKDAEEFAKNNLNVKNVYYDGLDLKTVNSFNKSILKYQQTLPEYQPNSIGSIESVNKAIENDVYLFLKDGKFYKDKLSKKGITEAEKWAKKSSKEFTYKFGKNTLGVSVNFRGVNNGDSVKKLDSYSGFFVSNKNKSSLTDELVDKNEKTGWFTKGAKGIEYILNHELGHEIDKLVDLRNDKDFQDFYKKEHKKGIKYVIENLSNYGATAGGSAKNKPFEMIAESWAEYVGSENPREISKTIGDLMLKKYHEKYIKNIDFKTWLISANKTLKK